MPHLDHKGPEGSGSRTGRGLGRCSKENKSDWPIGKGMAKRRRTESSGEGMGKRLKSGKEFEGTTE